MASYAVVGNEDERFVAERGLAITGKPPSAKQIDELLSRGATRRQILQALANSEAGRRETTVVGNTTIDLLPDLNFKLTFTIRWA